MKPAISEFSYGYALTEEIATGYGGTLRGAPVFPSLIAEGTTGGYDMELPAIGAPLFLQFKLSHYLTRSSALEWSQWNQPYYRMLLRPLRHSRQHNLLCAWEQAGNEVYYAAPTFYQATALNDAYLGRTMVQSSVFFRPQDIGALRDLSQHYVVFHPSDATAYFCSNEPRPIRLIHGEQWVKKAIFGAAERMADTTPEMFENLLGTMVGILAGTVPSWESSRREIFGRFPQHDTKSLAALLSYLARTYLDTQLIVVSTPAD
jgi:hypothetical protein